MGCPPHSRLRKLITSWYHRITTFLNHPLPQLRATRRTNLALLAVAILVWRALTTSVLVRASRFELPYSHHQRKKRLFRFLSNTGFDTIAVRAGSGGLAGPLMACCFFDTGRRASITNFPTTGLLLREVGHPRVGLRMLLALPILPTTSSPFTPPNRVRVSRLSWCCRNGSAWQPVMEPTELPIRDMAAWAVMRLMW